MLLPHLGSSWEWSFYVLICVLESELDVLFYSGDQHGLLHRPSVAIRDYSSLLQPPPAAAAASKLLADTLE